LECLCRPVRPAELRNDEGRPQEVGFPESWLRRVIRERSEQFLPPDQDEEVETDLPY